MHDIEMKSWFHWMAAVLLALPAVAQVDHYSEIRAPGLPDWEIPRAERHVLDNGMVVFLMEDHELPLIEVSARIRAGSRLDPPAKVGLADTVGTVLRTGGAGSRTGDEIDEFLESRGASVETGMEVAYGTASLSCLQEDFDEVLEIFSDVLREPRFEPDRIELAKVQARTAISRRNDDPSSIVRREFNKLIYGPDSAYARHAEYATVDAISRDDLITYHGRYYKPNNVVLGVVGDFDGQKMLAKLRRTFGSWKKGTLEVPEEFLYRSAPNPGVFQIDKPDINQSSVRIGHLGITYDHPDYHASQVLNQLFGIGFSSRIVQEIRSNRGLAYSVGSALVPGYDHPGYFVMVLQTKTGSTVEAIEALFSEIDRLFAEPPTEEELSQAKNGILNSFVFNFDDESEVMDRYLTYEYYGYPLDFLETFQRKVQDVTVDDVLRVAREHIHPERATVLVVGRIEDLDEPLASLMDEDGPLEGPKLVRSLDITIPEPKMEAPKATAASLDRGGKLLERMARNLGDDETLEDLRTLEIAGQRTVRRAQGSIDVRTFTYLVYPNRVRVEIMTPFGATVVLSDGQRGQMRTPRGTRPLPASEIEKMYADLARQPVHLARLIHEDGVEGQYLDSETVDGVEADVVLVSPGTGEPFRVYLSAETGRVIKTLHQGSTPAGGPAETETWYEDYREVEGITVPYKTRIVQNGEEVGTFVVERVTVNPELDLDKFEIPDLEEQEAAAAAATGS